MDLEDGHRWAERQEVDLVVSGGWVEFEPHMRNGGQDDDHRTIHDKIQGSKILKGGLDKIGNYGCSLLLNLDVWTWRCTKLRLLLL